MAELQSVRVKHAINILVEEVKRAGKERGRENAFCNLNGGGVSGGGDDMRVLPFGEGERPIIRQERPDFKDNLRQRASRLSLLGSLEPLVYLSLSRSVPSIFIYWAGIYYFPSVV